MKQQVPAAEATDPAFPGRLLGQLTELTGVVLPT